MTKKQHMYIILLLAVLGCHKDDLPPLDKWEVVYQIPKDHLLGKICFFDKNTGYVLMRNLSIENYNPLTSSYLLYTTNGGINWSKIQCTVPGKLNIISNIYPNPYEKNTLIGFASIALDSISENPSHRMMKSTDNGKNWSLLPIHILPNGIIDNYSALADISFLDKLTWILTDGSHIEKTTDGGITWNEMQTPDMFPSVFGDILFPSATIGYTYGGVNWDNSHFGYIAKTTDSGNSWQLLDPDPWKPVNTHLHDVITLQFLTPETGFMITEDGELYKSNDGALSWTLVNNTLQGCNGSYFLNENKGYFIGLSGECIYSTSDGGKNWRKEYCDTQAKQPLWNLYFLNTGEGFVQAGNKILKKM